MRLGPAWHLKQAAGRVSAALGELTMFEGRTRELGLEPSDEARIKRAQDELKAAFDNLASVVAKLQ